MTSKVYSDISVSADGHLAGPGQTADKPFGDRPVDRLHAWMFDTPDENQAEVDRVVSAGAFVMGRNMFGPVRGHWDPSWRGWWGEDPPYHGPCSCSPTTPATRWRCRAAPPSGSSPTASAPPLTRRARGRELGRWPSPAVPPRSTRASPPA